MHPWNTDFFEHVLPDFLQRTNELYGEQSLFIQLDSIKIQRGAVDVAVEKVEKGLYERKQTLSNFVNNATFSTMAVQCSHTITEKFSAPYCDDDIIKPAALERICSILKLSQEDVTLFAIGDNRRVLRVLRAEETITTYSEITLVFVELLSLLTDLQKPISSIEQILYPIEIFGKFRIVVDKDENATTLKMYSQFGSLCAKISRVHIAEEEEFVAEPLDKGQVQNDSPTINCLKKIGIDCSNIDMHETFTSMGLDSLKTAELELALQAAYPDYPLPTAVLYNYPTVDKMDAYLLSCANHLKSNKDASACSGCLPLSPQQRRFVFLSELEPDLDAQFNEPMIFRIGLQHFDQKNFVAALNAIVMRHTILRTTYRADCQIISSGTENYLASGDISNPEELVTFPIDIKRTSLHSALCYSANYITVCIVIHHVAIDGYSIGIIAEEMEAIYSGTQLLTLVSQYRDYARKVSTLSFKEELSKWKEKLDGRDFELLPADRPRTAKQTSAGRSYTKVVPQPTLSILQNLRKQTNCTEFCILVSVYKFLIYKTTGIADFPIGFPLSKRDKKFQKTVGCFVNTVPLLEKVDSSNTIKEYLVNVSAAIAEAKINDVPFDVLVSELNLEREDNVTPLFQVMLVMDKVQLPTKESGIAFVDLPTRFAKYEQIWYFRSDANSLSIKVEYNCDMFFKETIIDLVDRFLFVLQQFGRGSLTQKLIEISLTKECELAMVCKKKAAHVCDIPLIPVSGMLQKNLSTKSSLRIAEERMSYAELDERSSQFSQLITNKYCLHYGELPSRDRCGAIFMKRSLDLLVTVFAIWKSGLQVVPFSLDWPVRRAVETLKKLENPILITIGFEDLARAAVANFYPVVQKLGYPKTQMLVKNLIDVSDLAYITCTSGTTGTPKLVCTEFSGHCNLVVGYTRTFQLNQSSFIYQVVNYGFDIFFADLSKTFANGASMILADQLIPKVEEMRDVTNAYIMPAYLSSLHHSDIEKLKSLETVQFGGEAIQDRALKNMLETDIHFYQEHGVTEQTVYTTANRMKVRTPISEIGKPYSNLYLLTRDSDGQLLPERYQAVYYVSGLGITRGYYDMKALNSATISHGKFGREFRTGDIAKYQHGQLHFVGRADLQVKIRGRIVDLLEIRNHVTSHALVDACIVTVSDINGAKELIAYVIAKDSTLSAKELENYVSERLPAYCVPKHFVFLEKFPLNQNGKVDKRRLPKIDVRTTTAEPRTAQGELESTVVEAFKNYTGREFMANQCFFDYGGDSVKAMLVVQELERKGHHMKLKSFFALRTAEKIAAALQQLPPILEKIPESAKHVSFDLPLSPQQKRLWFLARMHPERDSYIIRLLVDINGNLEIKKFIIAFHSVIMVNSAARTVIVHDNQEPILSRRSGTECFHDLSQGKIADPEIDGNSLITAKLCENEQGFEFDIRIHHIISDGRSLAIFGEELAEAYNRGRLEKLEEVHESSQLCEFLDFWKEYLEGYEPCPSGKITNSEAVDGEAGYIMEDLNFISKLGIQEFCTKYKYTLYHLLVTAYVQTLRSAYNKDDVIIGTTVANRTPENMCTVGLFVNTIPLRFKKEFTELGQQLSYTVEQIISAMEHQNTPLAEIIEEVVKERDVGNTPLFQHVITFESTSIDELPEMEGVVTKCSTPRTFYTQFDQSWIFHPGEGLGLTVQYDKSRFSMEHVKELVDLFKRTLKGYLADKKLWSSGPLTQFSSNDTPRNKTLGLVFVKQCAETSILLCLESRTKLCYKEVFDRAQSLASTMQFSILQFHGIAPISDDIVCILMHESVELHIAIEASHLLGCAYLCLSPDTPIERLKLIVEDCHPKIFVAEKDLSPLHVNFFKVEEVLQIRKEPLICQPRSSSDSLAYLIYTSGSTGAPKGVCISHQSVMNMLEHATKNYHFRPGSKTLQFTKSSFDASISNTFGTLLNGGVLSIRDEEADIVQDLSKRQPIAVLHMTPIVMSMFDDQDLQQLKDVEKWSFGGETLSSQTLEVMLKKGKRMIQLYGPTEATCYQTLLNMKIGHESTCVGPVISNLPYGICSFKNHSIPRQKVGQFFCTGENLARGYVGKYSSAFVRNPYQTPSDQVLGRNSRIYLTGDEMKRDKAGYLHFLGRKDDQVKVKGHRIQLAELESLANKFEGIENAVAVLQKDKVGNNHVVLYFVGQKVKEKELDSWLLQRLPKFMLPSATVRLDELPVTSNGKIDRKLLSERSDINKNENIPKEARNDIESSVLESYRIVLKRNDLDMNSDFFRCGGHSLLVIRLIDELKKRGMNVQLLDVFRFSRIRELAERITSLNREVDYGKGELEDRLHPEEKPTPPQTTLLRSFRSRQLRSIYDISIKVTLKKELTLLKLIHIVNQLSMAHPSLRTRFEKIRGIFKMQVLSGTECYQNFSPNQGEFLNPLEKPPFLAIYDRKQVIIRTNHIITDGHSMRIIVGTIQRLLNNEEVKLDLGLRLHSWLLTQFEKQKEENIAFWQAKLHNFVYNQLPTSRPRQILATDATAELFEFQAPKLRDTINLWVRSYSCTPFVALFVLFSRVFQSLSYDSSIPLPVGFPVNLRPQELYNSVGYGISTVMVTQDLRGKLSEAIKNAMVQVAEAMAHAFLPYDEILRLSPSGKLFAVMVMLDNYSVYESEICTVEPEEAEVTKFEISVYAAQDNDKIRIEYNKSLFDKDFIHKCAEIIDVFLDNWDCEFPRTICRAFTSNGCIYDANDVKKMLEPLKLSDVNLITSTDNQLQLICSSDRVSAEEIERTLQCLPPPLRPKKIIVEPTYSFCYPLSKQQLQMYYLSLQDPMAYVLPFCKKFPKITSPKNLHGALLNAIQRHEMLRTIFFETEGEPKQMVASMTECYISLSIELSENIEESIAQIVNLPMQLQNRPLLEAVMYKTEDSFVAVLRLQHIISDAWSTSILEEELEKDLTILEAGGVPRTHRQSFTYLDYCKEGGARTKIDEIYLRKLAAAQEIEIVPSESKKVTVYPFDFPAKAASHWEREQRTSLFIILLRFLAETVMEQFNLQRVNIGCPSAIRSTKTKSIVGYFLNNIVFHVESQQNGENSFSVLQKHANSIFKQNIPFTDLAAQFQKMNGVLSPLFQVYFNCRYDLEYNSNDTDDISGLLPIRSQFPIEVDLDKRSSGFRITFRIQNCISAEGKQLLERLRSKILLTEEAKDKTALKSNPLRPKNKSLEKVLRLAQETLRTSSLQPSDNFFTTGGNSLQIIAFAERLEEELETEVDIADIYAAASFSELAEHLGTVSGSSPADSVRKVEPYHYDVSSPAIQSKPRENAKQECLYKKCDFPSSDLGLLLGKFCQSYESKVAFLEPDNGTKSYKDVMLTLWAQALSIRNSYIKIHGTTLLPDTVIPVIDHRSSSTILSCLSVIIAGGAYLPIDEDSPTARIETLLKESQASCYIGSNVPDVDSLPLDLGITTSQYPREKALMSVNNPNDLSYLIFTSGTTGTPKGVCIKHSAVANMMMAATKDFRIHSDDTVYQFTNFVYDNSVLEIFMTLGNGSRLLVETSHFHPRKFTAMIERYSITHYLLFPGLVSTFRDEHFVKLANLRYWIVGAEKLPQKLLDRAIECGVNVIQNYGPTETTAYALTKHMRKEDNSANLGRAIQNVKMQVDTNGECLVRGAGLMRGYLNKKKGTEFRASGQNNWYPTGDHVLLLKNEDVVFVGRKDNQVKISGHRVELGEIEAVIYRIPQVKQCKVLWQEEEQTLLAFCLANNGEVVIAEEVLKHCFTQLSKYMVPNHVIVLNEFPLTKNSKTDMEQLTQRWKQRKRKSAIVEGAETILGHAVDPNLGLFGNGATTYQAILTAKALEKNGKIVNAAELLQYPLTNQGDHFKVDNSDETLEEEHYRASKRMRNIWSKVLKHDNFNRNDNFFLVGGHSLLLLKLRYELNQEFNTALGIQDLLSALVFCQMVKILYEKKSNVRVVDLICSSPNPQKTLVFVHPLYGGNVPYAALIQQIRERRQYSILTVQHPNTFGFESDDPKFFESVQSLARSYASEIQQATNTSAITLVGASFGGTMAVEISNYLEVPCDVIVIDSGTNYASLNDYSLEEHLKNLESTLSNYEIDAKTLFWMQVNSWDLLQMLHAHNTITYPNVRNFHVFSVDGSDLGWSRFLEVTTVRAISGTHASMLTGQHGAKLAEEILNVLNCD